MMIERLFWKVIIPLGVIYSTLMLVIAIDAETDRPPSCVSCVVPAPHAWEDKR